MRRLLSYFSRFWSDRSGNIAIIFGLAIVPVMGSIGAAVDYSVANASRTAMQAALDNAALAISKQMPLSQSDMNTNAWNVFTGNLGPSPVVIPQGNLVITSPTTGKLVLDVTGTYTLGLGGVLKLVGMNTSFTVGAHSEVQWGNSRLRVALVLDNTGSMSSSGKIGALQTASKNLIDQLKGVATTSGDVYISIIPFARTVNLDSTNYNATWIDWTAWSAPPPNSTPAATVGPGSACPYTSSGSTPFRCLPTPTNSQTCNVVNSSTTGCAANIPSSGTYAGYICPSYDDTSNGPQGSVHYNGCYNSVQKPSQTVATGSGASCGNLSNCSCSGGGSNKVCTRTFPGQYNHTWIVNAHSTWNGCVMDRGTAAAPGTTAGYDQTVDAPAAGATAAPAQQYYYCNITVMGLTDPYSDAISLKNKVDAMAPNGSTNQPIGLVWGWQSLIGGGPFPAAPAKDPNYTYNQVIILLSDGLNTQDRWYGDGSTTSTQVDNRMYYQSGSTVSGTCKNIKDAGIKVYTVQVNTGGDPTSTLLQNCASDPSMFFMLTSSSQIVATFNQIGTALANLHLSM
jgi:Flp pilus assembly protein TadG